jgi:LAO/AO transport system kinase
MGELVRNDAAFVRPSPTSGTLGGVARRTREAMLLCEAAGFDVVLVETVGVGQSEVAVAAMVDCFMLLISPAGGDELQGIKRGIMELADLVVVNKADGDLRAVATITTADYANALHLVRPRTPAWEPRVLSCSALEGTGVADVWRTIEEFRAALTDAGELDARREDQARDWMWSEIADSLLDRLRSDRVAADLARALEAEVRAGRLAPTAAAEQVLRAFLDGSH